MVKVEFLGKPIFDIPAIVRGPTVSGTSAPNVSSLHFDWHNNRLVLTSDTDEFDPDIIEQWKDEGFQVAYLPYDGDKQAYQNKLQHLADPLELGEKFAIVGT